MDDIVCAAVTIDDATAITGPADVVVIVATVQSRSTLTSVDDDVFASTHLDGHRNDRRIGDQTSRFIITTKEHRIDARAEVTNDAGDILKGIAAAISSHLDRAAIIVARTQIFDDVALIEITERIIIRGIKEPNVTIWRGTCIAYVQVKCAAAPNATIAEITTQIHRLWQLQRTDFEGCSLGNRDEKNLNTCTNG